MKAWGGFKVPSAKFKVQSSRPAVLVAGSLFSCAFEMSLVRLVFWPPAALLVGHGTRLEMLLRRALRAAKIPARLCLILNAH